MTNQILYKLQNCGLGKNHNRLNDVTLELREGVTVLMGNSGSGKTSLINILTGFEIPDFGHMERCFTPQENYPDFFWVPQNQGIWSDVTLLNHLRAVNKEMTAESAKHLLARFNLAEFAEKNAGELSLGEQARLSVARCLASNSKILIMDEPLANVDLSSQSKYFDIISEYVAENNASWIFSTHAPKIALRRAQNAICLKQGKIIFSGDIKTLYAEPANEELSESLGEGNWFSAKDEWFKNNAESQTFCRPENLELIEDENGHIEVLESFQLGMMNQTTVKNMRNQHKTLYHKNCGFLKQGSKVILKISLFLLCILLFACSKENDKIPTYKKTPEIWVMPRADKNVPAPRSVNFDKNGNIYTLDTAGRILIYSPERKLLKSWWMPDYAIGKPEGIFILDNGHVIVSDTHYFRVVIFDGDGKVLKIFGKKGKGDGEFQNPVGVIADPMGNIYVCEYGGNDRIQKFTADGKFILKFSKMGSKDGELQRPSGMVWHKKKLYVADAVNNRIQVFTDQGKFIKVFAFQDDSIKLYLPYNIRMDEEENLYILEYGNSRFLKVNLEGKVLMKFGSNGSGLKNLSSPWGIAVNKKNIVVGDTGNRRLVKISR